MTAPPRVRSEADIRAALADARTLADAGNAGPALANAWGRRRGRRPASPPTGPTRDREDPPPPAASPAGLLSFAVTRGIVARDAHFPAVEALKIGDASEPGPDPPDPAAAVRAFAAVAEEALLTLRQWPLGALVNLDDAA